MCDVLFIIIFDADTENEYSVASWIKIKTQYGKKYYKSKVYRYIFINCTYLSQHYYSSDEGSKAGTANFVGDHIIYMCMKYESCEYGMIWW